MYPDNNWYGHRAVLNKYCEQPDREIFGTIQHGWVSKEEASEINMTKRKLNLAPYLAWNSNINSIYRDDKKIISIGAPFLYLDLIKDNRSLNKEIGTIFFPSHSVDTDYNQEHQGLRADVKHFYAIKEIENTSEGPFTVSLYYTDLNDPNIRNIYLENNWNIVSFGNRNSKDFLYKMYNEIVSKKNFVTTDYTSGFFYAMFLKKKVRFMREIIYNKKVIELFKVNSDNKIFFKIDKLIINNIKKEIPEIFKGYSFNEKIYNFSLNELGYSSLKSKDELINLLGLNSFVKKKISYFYSRIIKLNHFKKKILFNLKK